MKNSRMKITAVLLMAAFMFSGCGEALYEMTPEEEAAVVSYAAHAVSKYNTFQQDGEIYIQKDEVALTEEAETEITETEIAETDADGMVEPLVEEDAEAEVAETAGKVTEGATLTEALDLGVVRAEYMGNALYKTYKKSDVFAIDAREGKQLLVLDVNLTNTIDQDLHIDILAMTPTFRAVINGSETVPLQTTILPDDLSTYQQDILAGATNTAVLVFEIPQDIQEVSSIQLKVTMNGNNFTVNL